MPSLGNRDSHCGDFDCCRTTSETRPVGLSLILSFVLMHVSFQGMHVKDLGAQAGVNPNKLSKLVIDTDLSRTYLCSQPARVLRLLATNYIFKEVAPDTYAHNRTSTCLDTGKSLKEILAE